MTPDHGERIATLEARYMEVVNRLNHLDECIDSVRNQAAENADLVRKNSQVWDERWFFGKGAFWTAAALATILGGIGLVRLNEILNALAKFTK
jgi:hypothetical protein